MQDFKISQTIYKGCRNDLGEKFVSGDYFYTVKNFNQDNIVGADKVFAPLVLPDQYTTGITTSSVDGIYEFKYLNAGNKLVTENIKVAGGIVFRGLNNEEIIYSGLTEGKCTFAIYQDKLFIANGKNYPLIYDGESCWEMGAPKAVVYSPWNVSAKPNGTYQYAVTYVTAGGEEVLGSVSAPVTATNQQIKLTVPIGYDGTLKRKVYRATTSEGIYRRVGTIDNNTTMDFYDNKRDSELGGEIPTINNECPKPYFIRVNNYRLCGCVSDRYPTQMWVTDTYIELFDNANFVDVSNRGSDNSPLVGMEDDYNLVVIASKKQIYVADVTGSDNIVTVNPLRANIGCLNGYTMVKTPSNEVYQGGVLMVTTDYSIRLINGNYAMPVATSLDNVKTDNWGQPMRGLLVPELTAINNTHAVYNDFKYHLAVNDKVFTFDVRTLGWMFQEYRTTNYNSTINTFGVINEELYNGQHGSPYVEKMYWSEKYYNESLPAELKFPFLQVDDGIKYFKSLIMYFGDTKEIDLTIDIYMDNNPEPLTFDYKSETGAIYDSRKYSDSYYEATLQNEDFLVLPLNLYAQWIQPVITVNSGYCEFKGHELIGSLTSSKEIGR